MKSLRKCCFITVTWSFLRLVPLESDKHLNDPGNPECPAIETVVALSHPKDGRMAEWVNTGFIAGESLFSSSKMDDVLTLVITRHEVTSKSDDRYSATYLDGSCKQFALAIA